MFHLFSLPRRSAVTEVVPTQRNELHPVPGTSARPRSSAGGTGSFRATFHTDVVRLRGNASIAPRLLEGPCPLSVRDTGTRRRRPRNTGRDLGVTGGVKSPMSFP